MNVRVFHYPKCSTCKKALRWLDDHGVAYTALDITKDTPNTALLRDMWERSGLPLKRFFNTSGRLYRGGDYKNRIPNMSDDEQLADLAGAGMLIRRPIVDAGEHVLVGFKETTYAEAFSS